MLFVAEQISLCSKYKEEEVQKGKSTAASQFKCWWWKLLQFKQVIFIIIMTFTKTYAFAD